MRKTRISISEKICSRHDVHPAMRRDDKIIIHDGWQWLIGKIHNEKELKEVLNFLEIELTDIDHEVEWETTGKIKFYNLSKNINRSYYAGGFWNMEQLEEDSKSNRLKRFKGLSNGSLVDCYAEIDDDIITIHRPNPNAKEVYNKMALEDEMQYRINNWYL